MRPSVRPVVIGTAMLLLASMARAQSSPPPTINQQAPATAGSNESARPATTTFYGDTGLWYVPSAEILPHGQFSLTIADRLQPVHRYAAADSGKEEPAKTRANRASMY